MREQAMSRNRFQSLLPALRSGSRSGLSRGFSLIEVLVASAVFLLIMLAVYQVYMRSLEGHKLGVNQAELIQSTRFGFEEMANRIRSAGYEFDLDGPPTDSPNQSDESIEYMASTAIAVRSNYDFASEAFRGREVLYEQSGGGCCPIVTTGNDEILAFALSKDEGAPNQPTESMTLYLDLDAPRNGIVSMDSGLIEGEEAITIPNVALTDFSDPPYVLYQFTWSDDGVLERRPLVDNILELEFQYSDEGGNDLSLDAGGNDIGLPAGGPNPAADGDPSSDGRARRERARKIKIRLKAMTPEPDLRYVDPDDADPVTQKHRKWELVQEVHTFNVGRRGQKDKNTDPPESVTDVQLCSGQCGMVRVDWSPGPPEDRISDHIVILAECTGGSSPNYDQPLASFIVVSDLDLTVDPEREYAVFDSEDDADLIAGTEVCARVIARDSSGAESVDPSDSNDNTALDQDSSNDYTVIQDYSRSEAPANGKGSGYDEEDSDWPNAVGDNGSGVEITTDGDEDSYPLENSVLVTFESPRFTLNRLSTGGGSLFDWTTKEDTGTASSELDVDPGEICHRIELSPDDGTANLRTPNEELASAVNQDRPNVYVFRVSASDSSNWGPEQGTCPAGGSCIGEPRNFMPYAGNLHAFYSASLSGGSFTFSDSSDSVFLTQEGSIDQYEDRFISTESQSVRPFNADLPLKALTPGEVYYYRVRLVDNCWSDGDLNGIEDSTEDTPGEQPLTAWSTVDDFPDEQSWREASVRISPFYPPLLKRNNAAGERDKPSNSVDDSDGVTLTNLSALNTYAVPAYTIPQKVVGNTYVRPEKPTEFLLTRSNDNSSDLLPDSAGVPGVRVVFNAAKRTSPQDTSGAGDLEPVDVGYTWYRLMRKSVTYTPGTGAAAANLNWQANDPTAEVVTEFRLSAFGQREYTLDRASAVVDGMNTALNNPALYLDAAAAGNTYHYKLFTAQVTDGQWYDPANSAIALPLHVGDDGITPASETVRYSVGSRGFLFPTDFGDDVVKIDVEPNNDGLNSTLVEVEVTINAAEDPSGTCPQVKSARLLAYDQDRDQFLGSSDWIATTGCDFDFNATLIDQALRTYPDRTRFRVEISEADESLGGGAWDKEPLGARAVSGMLGESGEFGITTACVATVADIDCGDNSNPQFLGSIADQQISMDAEDRELVIDIPIDLCNTTNFAIQQLELVLTPQTATFMPEFLEATLTPQVGSKNLPPPERAEIDGGEYILRWGQDSFCDAMGNNCTYPVIPRNTAEAKLRLRFAGKVCDPVRLTQFNFRIPINPSDDGLAEDVDLLCSNRGEYVPDSPGSTQEPAYYCSSTGVNTDDCGRGPAIDPPECGIDPNCEPQCDPGVCPVNDGFTDDPAIFLEADGIDPDRIVRIQQTEDCSVDCDLELTEITARFVCGASRDCSTNNLPNFVSARLIHGDATAEFLPMPDIDYVADDHIELDWPSLTGRAVVAGETFDIEFTFDGPMNGTELETWHLQFGTPLAATANCDEADVLPIPN